MKVHNSIQNFNTKKRHSVLTIGTFDGVHLGHQKLINQLNTSNKEGNSVLLTFFPHPRKVLQNGKEIKMLNTINEKIKLLNRFGLDHLVIEPFTEEFSQQTALDFVKDVLIEKLFVKKLIIGYDHHFGKNREGNFEQLQKYGEHYNFDVEKITAQEIENTAISSTKIKKAIEDGAIEKANSYLGYAYLLSGKVVKGLGLGKTIQYRTVNIYIEETYKLIPKKGVYIVRTILHDKTIFGIMNIGFRPTVQGKNQTIEVHLLDFKANLYDTQIQIEVLKRLREEQKFDSLEILSQQIKKDEQIARNWIAKQV